MKNIIIVPFLFSLIMNTLFVTFIETVSFPREETVFFSIEAITRIISEFGIMAYIRNILIAFVTYFICSYISMLLVIRYNKKIIICGVVSFLFSLIIVTFTSMYVEAVVTDPDKAVIFGIEAVIKIISEFGMLPYIKNILVTFVPCFICSYIAVSVFKKGAGLLVHSEP